VSIISLDARLLPREDAAAAAVLATQFERETIGLALGAKILRVEKRGGAKVVVFERNRGQHELVGDEVLVAIGRTPNLDGLGLQAAGVKFDAGGVLVDDRLRSSNRKIFAAGDICSAYKFTHVADAMARVVLQMPCSLAASAQARSSFLGPRTPIRRSPTSASTSRRRANAVSSCRRSRCPLPRSIAPCSMGSPRASRACTWMPGAVTFWEPRRSPDTPGR